MSKEAFQQIMQKERQGVLEAAKEGLQALAPGLSLNKILSDVGSELGRLGVQGQMEMASALFNGNAFVQYGPGQNTPSQENAQGQTPGIEAMKQPEVQQEQSRGGMEM